MYLWRHMCYLIYNIITDDSLDNSLDLCNCHSLSCCLYSGFTGPQQEFNFKKVDNLRKGGVSDMTEWLWRVTWSLLVAESKAET